MLFQVAKGQLEAGGGGGRGATGAVTAGVPRAGAAPVQAPPHARRTPQGTGVVARGNATP